MIGGGSTTTRVVGIYMPDMDTHEEAEERVGSTEQKQRERGLAGGELAKRASLKGSAAHPGRWMLRGLLMTKSCLNAVCDWVARVHDSTALTPTASVPFAVYVGEAYLYLTCVPRLHQNQPK